MFSAAIFLCVTTASVKAFSTPLALRGASSLQMCANPEGKQGLARRDALKVMLGTGIAAFAGAALPSVTPGTIEDWSVDQPKHMWDK